jgi:hypothetical protein
MPGELVVELAVGKSLRVEIQEAGIIDLESSNIFIEMISIRGGNSIKKLENTVVLEVVLEVALEAAHGVVPLLAERKAQLVVT